MSGLFCDVHVSCCPQILVTNTARRLVVIDVERGDQELCYDNCECLCYSGQLYNNLFVHIVFVVILFYLWIIQITQIIG